MDLFDINVKPFPSPNPVVYKPKGSNNRTVLLQLGPGTILVPEGYKVGVYSLLRIPNLGLLYLGFRLREISLTLALESSSDTDSLVQFCYNAEDACKFVVVYVVVKASPLQYKRNR